MQRNNQQRENISDQELEELFSYESTTVSIFMGALFSGYLLKSISDVVTTGSLTAGTVVEGFTILFAGYYASSLPHFFQPARAKNEADQKFEIDDTSKFKLSASG